MAPTVRGIYSTDLAYVHDSGFGEFARRVAPALVRMLRAHRLRPGPRPEGRIVEVGCGSGILARHLLRAGWRVLGLDASRAMVRLARTRVPGATFRVATLAAARLPRCAAVLALGEVVSYVTGLRTGPEALFGFFRRAHDALQPGGILVFDFLESDRGRTFRRRTLSGPDWEIRCRAEVDRRGFLTRWITTVREIGDRCRRSEEKHRLRIYHRREIASALNAAGFIVRMSRSYGPVRLLPGGVAVVASRARPRAASPARPPITAVPASTSLRSPTNRSRRRGGDPGGGR